MSAGKGGILSPFYGVILPHQKREKQHGDTTKASPYSSQTATTAIPRERPEIAASVVIRCLGQPQNEKSEDLATRSPLRCDTGAGGRGPAPRRFSTRKRMQ